MAVIGYIVVTNTDDETGGGAVIDVETVIKESDGAFIYQGVRHGTTTVVGHKQYEEASLHKSAATALASAAVWKGH